jgi:hypothetical protein
MALATDLALGVFSAFLAPIRQRTASRGCRDGRRVEKGPRAVVLLTENGPSSSYHSRSGQVLDEKDLVAAFVVNELVDDLAHDQHAEATRTEAELEALLGAGED